MWRTVYIQAGIALGVALLWCFHSTNAAGSALAGGLAVVLPAALLVWRLRIGARNNEFVVSFFLGEATKVFLSMALLALVGWRWQAWFGQPLDWLALLVGFIAALQGYVVGLAFQDKNSSTRQS
jgi:F0F1-type ATP synthase assembly protein I